VQGRQHGLSACRLAGPPQHPNSADAAGYLQQQAAQCRVDHLKAADVGAGHAQEDGQQAAALAKQPGFGHPLHWHWHWLWLWIVGALLLRQWSAHSARHQDQNSLQPPCTLRYKL